MTAYQAAENRCESYQMYSDESHWEMNFESCGDTYAQLYLPFLQRTLNTGLQKYVYKKNTWLIFHVLKSCLSGIDYSVDWYEISNNVIYSTKKNLFHNYAGNYIISHHELSHSAKSIFFISTKINCHIKPEISFKSCFIVWAKIKQYLLFPSLPCEVPLSGEMPVAAGHCCCCCLGLVSFQPSLPTAPGSSLSFTVPEGIAPLLFCNISRQLIWPQWRKKQSKVQTDQHSRRFAETAHHQYLSSWACTEAFN